MWQGVRTAGYLLMKKALWRRDIWANSLWRKSDYTEIVGRAFQAEKTASPKALEQELERIFTEKEKKNKTKTKETECL